jgi:hypothetical protein
MSRATVFAALTARRRSFREVLRVDDGGRVGQGDHEFAALARRTPHRHVAAVGAGHSPHERKPEACPAAAAVAAGTEPVEDEVQPIRQDPAAAVGDDDPGGPAGPPPDDRQLYDIVCQGVTHGVLKQRVERESQSLPVGVHADMVQQADLPGPLGGRAPSPDELHAHLVESDEFGAEEIRVDGRGDEQQALGYSPQSAQFADHDLDVLALLLARQVAGQQFGVAERDSDRGPQLVRGVLEELVLVVKQQRVLLADPARGRLGRLLAAHMPDHRHEDGRHQRHLGQFRQRLKAVDHVEPDAGRGGNHHGGEDPGSGLDRPGAESVDQGQAKPDDVKRDRLPARHPEHLDQVQRREDEPGEVDHARRMRPPEPGGQRASSGQRADNPHPARS